MRRLIVRESGDNESLFEFLSWLTEKRAWEVVDEVAHQFDHTISSNQMLLYGLGRARKLQGNEKLAKELADKAFKLPVQAANAVDAEMQLRWRSLFAERLQIHGMFDWSEREYRGILATGPVDSDVVARARLALAELFHDQQRDAEAAELVRVLSTQVRDNAVLRAKLTQPSNPIYPRFPPNRIQAKIHYYEACRLAAKSDWKGQAAELDQVVKVPEAEDDLPDVLIDLYRLPNQDEARRKKTSDLIKFHAAAMLRLIASATQGNNNEDSDDEPVGPSGLYNNYAWLVGNTEGNLDLALQYAHKAVELGPKAWINPVGDEADRNERDPVGAAVGYAGRLDTLAHCYAGKKDWANAVKWQSRAVALAPYSLPINRELEKMRKAQQAAKPAGAK